MRTESASAHAQQLRVEQVERFAVVEQQLQKFQQEQEKLKGNEERGRVEQVERMAVVEQQLQDLQQEQEQLKGSEERWRIVEQKLGEPGIGPGERERQERLEERLNIVDQQLLDQDRRRSMVEQQWHNRHARRLEEQAKLLQELRDEQERLRDEQEKIKDNEQRIGEKNNMSGAAQSGSAGPGSLQSVLAAFDAASDARRTVRTALQQMVHAQEQYKREAEWSAEEETCSGGSNERGAEKSESPTKEDK